MLGSVYGLYAGLKRSFFSPRRSKNWCSTPMRSPKVSPLSHTSPSTWWNSAKCVRSMDSFLKENDLICDCYALAPFLDTKCAAKILKG